MHKFIFCLVSLLISLFISSCDLNPVTNPTPIPIIEEFTFEQVIDNGNTYTSKDFFDVGFKEYKEYNVSKLTGSIEAWYGFWGPDEDSVKYYELRFYPDHSTAVSEGTPFADDITGVNAKLNRKETMWRVGISDRRVLKAPKINLRTGDEVVPKYYEYLIFSNFVLLCQGWDVKESITNCYSLLDLLGVR